MGSAAFAAQDDEFDGASASVRWVMTDAHGLVLQASRAAAELLNVSISGLRHRQLLTFFDGEREHWRRALAAAAGGLMVDREGPMRPREKRPVRVRAEITKSRAETEADALLWTFTAANDH